jgi:hypothetical protein
MASLNRRVKQRTSLYPETARKPVTLAEFLEHEDETVMVQQAVHAITPEYRAWLQRAQARHGVK